VYLEISALIGTLQALYSELDLTSVHNQPQKQYVFRTKKLKQKVNSETKYA
jgi:hypothetical protein